MDEHGSVAHSVTANHHYAYNGKLMLFSLFALVTISIIVALFHYYAVWANQRRRNREFRPHRGTITITTNASTPPLKEGLERSVINSIASFSYDAASHDLPLECAVCLSEFVDKELGRVLPNCNHCFHIDCIDMWFYSRSNCPLCRAPVKPIENPVGNVTSAGETSGSGSGLANVHLRVVDDNVGGSSSSLLRKPPELVGIIVEIPTMKPDFGDSDTTRQEKNQKSNSR